MVEENISGKNSGKKIIGIKLFMLLAIIAFLILNSFLTLAIPSFPTEFYGNITYYNQPVSKGYDVQVLYDNNSVCGEFKVQKQGYYGLLSCLMDDLTTPEIEGSPIGITPIFKVEGQKATLLQNTTTYPGSFIRVDLVVPEIVCGDSFCSIIGENCMNCPQDCGVCENETTPTNTTTNTTDGTITDGTGDSSSGDTSGDSTGTGSGDGGGGGGGGLGSIDYGSIGGLTGDQGLPGSQTETTCVEDWVCEDWEECPPSEVQTRNCTDMNNCGTFEDKPPEKQECIYELVGINESLEEEPSKPETQKPMQTIFPKIVCEKEANPLKNEGIWFFILIIVIILIRFNELRKALKKIDSKKTVEEKENQDLEEGVLTKTKKAKLKFSNKRKAYLFIGLLSFFAILAYLFYVFFFLCEINFSALWIILATLIILPLIINKVLHHFEYHEHEKILQLERISDTHYKQIKKLIEIENENISEIENEIGEKMLELSNNEDFNKLLDDFPELRTLYHDLLAFFKDYQQKKNLLKNDAKLADDIYELSNREGFKDLTE